VLYFAIAMVMPFNSLLFNACICWKEVQLVMCICYEIQICLQLVAKIGAKGGSGKCLTNGRCVVKVKGGSSLHHFKEITGPLDACKRSSLSGVAWHLFIELYLLCWQRPRHGILAYYLDHKPLHQSINVIFLGTKNGQFQ
jgi:hypothetical protein